MQYSYIYSNIEHRGAAVCTAVLYTSLPVLSLCTTEGSTRLGLYQGLLHTAAALQPPAKLTKHLQVEGLCVWTFYDHGL